MTARNDITGDAIATRATTDAYRDNYDRIFGKKAPTNEINNCDACGVVSCICANAPAVVNDQSSLVSESATVVCCNREPCSCSESACANKNGCSNCSC